MARPSSLNGIDSNWIQLIQLIQLDSIQFKLDTNWICTICVKIKLQIKLGLSFEIRNTKSISNGTLIFLKRYIFKPKAANNVQ